MRDRSCLRFDFQGQGQSSGDVSLQAWWELRLYQEVQRQIFLSLFIKFMRLHMQCNASQATKIAELETCPRLKGKSCVHFAERGCGLAWPL